MWNTIWNFFYRHKIIVMILVLVINLTVEFLFYDDIKIMFALVFVQITSFIGTMCYAAFRIEIMVRDGENVYRD